MSAKAQVQPGWRQLNVGVVGGGIGGMCTALALRRQGHKVTIYERYDFAGEVGASISCAANGTRWLLEWGVDMEKGDPVELKKLISRDWQTGEPVSTYELEDYVETWGCAYNMFHRQYMHTMIMDAALSESGEGTPAKLIVQQKCTDIDFEAGIISFDNGNKAQYELIIGCDGINSSVRDIMGITPVKRPAPSVCMHANVQTAQAVEAGLFDYSIASSLQYWGGRGDSLKKIVLSPCNGGKLLSYYCFSARPEGANAWKSWREELTLEQLLQPYPDLDPQVLGHLKISDDVRNFPLWIHDEYPFWSKNRTMLMGDAAHPMMPHQSQGACMVIEDAATIGVAFGKKHFDGNIEQAIRVFTDVRRPRARRLQDTSLRAMYNINERIAFSSDTKNRAYKVANEADKLTIEEVNLYDIPKEVADAYAALSEPTQAYPVDPALMADTRAISNAPATSGV